MTQAELTPKLEKTIVGLEPTSPEITEKPVIKKVRVKVKKRKEKTKQKKPEQPKFNITWLKNIKQIETPEWIKILKRLIEKSKGKTSTTTRIQIL